MARLSVVAPTSTLVQELAWFTAGAAAVVLGRCLFVALGRRRPRQQRPATGRAPAEKEKQPEVGATRTQTPSGQFAETRATVKALGDELATLASGIEGRAHLLVETAPDRRNLPRAAEGMLRAVQRLRTLHRKMIAFAVDRAPAHGKAELDDVVVRLAEDLQQLQLGLELHWHPPATLPPVAVAPGVVGDALLFLSAAMIRAEPGARRLTLVGEMSLRTNRQVKLELSLEWAEEADANACEMTTDSGPQIDFAAAANLVRAQGGTIELTHVPGRFVRALVRLPAAMRDAMRLPEVVLEPAVPVRPAPAVAEAEPEPPPRRRHDFGGALLLEPDPTVRAMVASELKASGRAVFACADSSSARAFLETTPERFEVLVVDHPRRLAPTEALTNAVRTAAPELKVFVLDGETPSQATFASLHSIPKPFGVHELREALALVLTPR